MIRQLQNRFIRIAVVALTVAMVLVVGIVNIANWISVRKELSDTLNLLDQTSPVTGSLLEETSEEPAGNGRNSEKTQEQIFPAGPKETPESPGTEKKQTSLPKTEERDGRIAPGPFAWPNRHFRNMVAETNWFSAVVTEDGEVKRLLLDRLENLDEDSARELVLQAASDGRSEGFIQDYLFRIQTRRDGGKQVVIMNCETRLATVRTLILISSVACAFGIALAWLLVTLASRKAVEPTIRNIEQQKQFITNASHELKTPLTVIATNMELLEMETENNPWVRSTQKQTDTLRHLVDELVYLSRMEEEHATLEMEQMDVGELLKETAEPFMAVAEYHGKEMFVTAEEELKMTGERSSIQRLMSTLCDNAVKYASDGPIRADIRAEGKNHILLKVSNPVAEPLTKQQCEQLFNRFYRVDSSRNKEKQSGFGIGLAIAAAIAEKHGGRISAAMEGERLVFSCLLPREAKNRG